MKKQCLLFLTFIGLFTAIGKTNAQQAEGISYQAVIRGSTGMPVADRTVNLQFSVVQGTMTGSTVYSENQMITTTAQGLVNANIGTGTVVSGTWNTIPWNNGPYFINVQVDTTGGTSFVDLGTTQLASVPFAKQSGGLTLFASGTMNPTQMVISHSPAMLNYGLRYNDTLGTFEYVSGGTKTSSIELNTGDISTNGNVTAIGNMAGTNINATGNVTATGNLSGNNLMATGTVSGATVNASGNITATGNVAGNNLNATGNVTATGNLTGTNLTATGTVSGATVNSSGNITASGNVGATNVNATGNVTATGTLGGTNITATGTVSGATVSSAGNITATGNLDGNNITATGNINGNNITATGTVGASGVTATGTVTGASVTATGALSGASVTATGTVSGANVSATGNVTATGNISSDNVTASGNVSVSGKVTRGADTSNMLAIAWGTISAAGTLLTGSNNVSVTHSGTGAYTITIAGETYATGNYTAIATLSGGIGFIQTNSLTGNLVINTYNVTSLLTDNIFQFVVYKK